VGAGGAGGASSGWGGRGFWGEAASGAWAQAAKALKKKTKARNAPKRGIEASWSFGIFLIKGSFQGQKRRIAALCEGSFHFGALLKG
jgi:hypothetical protein